VACRCASSGHNDRCPCLRIENLSYLQDFNLTPNTLELSGDARSATSLAEATNLCRLHNFKKAPARSVRYSELLAAQKLIEHEQTALVIPRSQKPSRSELDWSRVSYRAQDTKLYRNNLSEKYLAQAGISSDFKGPSLP